MGKRFMMMLSLLLLVCGLAQAQTKITGTVVFADDNEPAMGASVLVVGTSHGVVTDGNGKFTVTLPAGQTKLRISFMGMETQTVTARNGMKVSLKSSASTTLNDVVVTGLQSVDKRLFTGAAVKVDAEKAKIDGIADISRSLEGRVAGVSVQNVSGTFGTAPKIRVRGATSIYGSSKPLWVVDGVIMEDVTDVDADQLSSGDAVTLISSAIAGLNSDDIESFQILKDGSATSIYGARAMSGVIVVTTKKGKAGTTRISYTGEYTMRLKPSYHDFNIMNSQDQMGIYQEMENNGLISFSRTYRAASSGVYGKMYQLMNTYNPATGGYMLENTTEAKYKYLRAAEMRNTDWFDELFSNSISMNHSVSMSTGTEKAQYYASFSLMDDPGWTEQSKVKRYTANINANYNVSKKVTVNMIANTAYRNQRAPGTTSYATDPFTGASSRDFDINPYSYALNSSRTLDPHTFYQRNFAPFNIHNELANNFIDLDVFDLKFQAELKYKPIRTVELSVLGAYKVSATSQANQIRENSNMAMSFRAMDDATMRDANNWLYTDPDEANTLPVSVLPNGGFYNEDHYSLKAYDFRATASYNDVYNEDHILNVFGGMELNNTDRRHTNWQGVGMQYDMGYLPNYDYLYFKQGVEENNLYYGLSNTYNREVSFFGTSTYSWKGRYIINGTMRYEGSNRLGKATSARWLPTWNVSGAWNAHEETWFENLKPTFSHATLKASYSLTGDKPAVTNSQVIITAYNPWRPFGGDKESGLEIYDIANPDLTYEKKHEFNLGVDLGFLDNRLNVTFDWYRRNNYDLIGPRTTTGTKGVITEYANVASMKSYGEELSISSKNIVNKDFQWSTDFIFSHVKTKVTKLESATTQIYEMISQTGFTMKGYPYRSLFSMDFKGLNAQGMPTFVNEAGEIVTSDIDFQSNVLDHLVYEGPTDPTITGSLGNTFSWKNWHLNVFITYAFGNVVRLDPAFYASYSDLDAMPKEFKNRWTVPGDEKRTDIPAIADLRTIQQDGLLSLAFNAYNKSTARIAKGDFIRMKEISLAYDFPKSWISHLGLSSASAKLQATNLFLIYADKKLYGQDPEFWNTGGVAIPMPKQFTFTLRLGL